MVNNAKARIIEEAWFLEKQKWMEDRQINPPGHYGFSTKSYLTELSCNLKQAQLWVSLCSDLFGHWITYHSFPNLPSARHIWVSTHRIPLDITSIHKQLAQGWENWKWRVFLKCHLGLVSVKHIILCHVLNDLFINTTGQGWIERISK